jgi:hypothetical protein
MKSSNGKALSLHDSLSLGEVELGLSSEHRPSEEEVRRLPLLLRLLSSSRPLSCIPSFPLLPEPDAEENDEASSDAIIQQAVNRLEDRAALYSAAEGVEVVACHLAPYVCRKISRLMPLQKSAAGEFATEDLSFVAANPVLSSRSKRQKTSSETPQNHRVASGDGNRSDDLQTDVLLDEDEDEDMVDASVDAAATSATNINKRRLTSERESVLGAGNAEDSQEATVTKTLSELALLVVQSLQTTPRKEDDGEGEHSSLSLTIEDSILAEARQGSADIGSVGGAVVASDLGSMVASLMHHAPVLRHQHVAVRYCEEENGGFSML